MILETRLKDFWFVGALALGLKFEILQSRIYS